MKGNRTITFALTITHLLLAGQTIFYLLFLGFMIQWYVNPGTFCNIDISSGFKAGIGFDAVSVKEGGMKLNALPLCEVHHVMGLWLVVRNSIFWAISVFIVLKARKILLSTRDIHAFYYENIRTSV
ncbi:MAG: hypothetical protein R3C61_09030 [Bacteroidia bacterium]